MKNSNGSQLKNIIFIGIDALRFDALSCEKDNRFLREFGVDGIPDTPEINRYAETGVQFSQCIATAPYTSASFASIFTGLYPPRHNVRSNYYTKISPEVKTLPQYLKDAGYQTFQILDLSSQLNPLDITKGVDHQFLSELRVNQTDNFFSALESRKDGPAFVFAYFLDASNPYGFTQIEPYEGYNSDFFKDMDELKDQYLADEKIDDRPDRYYTWCRLKKQLFENGNKREIVERYFRGVNRFSEGRFKWFMERMGSLGLLDNAIVVITADHGEDDYGFDFTHGGLLTEGILRVPLIISSPDILPSNLNVIDQVSIADITPTILDICGIHSDCRFDGQSILRILSCERNADVPAYAEVWAYQWEKMRKFMFTNGINSDREPPYEVFLKQRVLRHSKYKYSIFGEENRAILGRMSNEAIVKWACRNIFFRHENDPELKFWWEKLHDGKMPVEELLMNFLNNPDAVQKHQLYDLEDDPFERNNMLADPRNADILNIAVKLQDELINIASNVSTAQKYRPTVWSNIEINNMEKDSEKDSLQSMPLRLLTDLTNRCNIRCRICYRNYSSREDMDFRKKWFRDLARMFSALKELQLSCDGEPFIYRDIMEIMDILEEYPHLFTVAVTNGTMLGKLELQKKIISSISRLGISFDGSSKETYEYIRRGASYEKVLENIRAINRLRKESGINRNEIIFHFVPIKSNINELPDLIRLADSLDVRLIKAKHLGIATASMNNALDGEGMYYHRELYNNILEQSIRIAQEYGVTLDFPPPYNVAEKKKENSASNRTLMPCHEPWESAYITPAGNVKPCCGSSAVFGNLKNNSFEKIWNSQEYRDLRKTVNSESPLDMCRNCTSAGVRGRISKEDSIKTYFRYDIKETDGHACSLSAGGNKNDFDVRCFHKNLNGNNNCHKKKEYNMNNLKSAIWFLTWKCNNKCPYCWEVQRQARGEFTPGDFIETEKWIEAWNRLKPGTLDISGGEPWLQPGFIDMLEGFDEGIKVAITTNATKDMTEFVQRVSPEKVFSMTLSFHPTQRQSADIFLGKCLMLKNRGFNITVNFVTWPEQMWLIPDYKQFFESHELRFHVDPYASTPYNPYKFNDHEKEFLRQYVGGDRSHWFGEVEKYPVLCSGGREHLNVQPDGTAYRCINDKIFEKGAVGNILDHEFSLNKVWTRCDDYHRCPGCDKDKINVTRIKQEESNEVSEPLSYTL